ncbi:Ig domain-containing protein group 1 domain-containing protein [Halobacteriales archaeon QS_4_62_28]|nr:MAG: Ig domain-containing protein group 1 domain-containing protein [Halobacteriales archaeon QS_4_62_28]
MFEELWRDDRAIEGLPIRLVIALVVGVASLSVMMNTITGLGTLTVSELDVDPAEEVIGPGETEMNLTVLDSKSQPVSGATVVITGGTATLEGTTAVTATTGPHGNVSVLIDPTLGPNQQEGTITIDVKPPASGGYSDRRSNTNILVVAGHE